MYCGQYLPLSPSRRRVLRHLVGMSLKSASNLEKHGIDFDAIQAGNHLPAYELGTWGVALETTESSPWPGGLRISAAGALRPITGARREVDC